MNEVDAGVLFHAHVDSVVTILFGYFSVTSAFLAASYLVASSVPKLLAYVMVSLYSVTTLALIGYCERHFQVALGLRSELRHAGATWHAVVNEPEFVFPLLSYSMIVSMLAIFVASVWYFFYARNSAP